MCQHLLQNEVFLDSSCSSSVSVGIADVFSALLKYIYRFILYIARSCWVFSFQKRWFAYRSDLWAAHGRPYIADVFSALLRYIYQLILYTARSCWVFSFQERWFAFRSDLWAAHGRPYRESGGQGIVLFTIFYPNESVGVSSHSDTIYLNAFSMQVRSIHDGFTHSNSYSGYLFFIVVIMVNFIPYLDIPFMHMRGVYAVGGVY